MQAEGRAEILVSFHGIGQAFRGLLVASACFFWKDTTEAGESATTGVVPIADELFQINDRESIGDLEERFERWLSPAIVVCLEMFRRDG